MHYPSFLVLQSANIRLQRTSRSLSSSPKTRRVTIMGTGSSNLCRSSKRAPVQIMDSSSLEKISKSMSFEESFALIGEAMDYLKQDGVNWRSMDTYSALHFLRHYSGPLKTTTYEQRQLWAVALQQHNFPSRFLQWWPIFFGKKIFQKQNEDLARNFRMIIGICWNCTETSDEFCRDFYTQGGLALLIQAMNSSLLSPKALEEDRSCVSRLYAAHACGSICHNVLSHCRQSKEKFRESGGLEAVSKYLSSSLDIIKCKALLCMAFSVNDNESHMIIATNELLQYLLKLLNDCVAHSDHVGRLYPFSAGELVKGFNKIAVNDENKSKLMQLGILEPYGKMISAPKDDNELLAVLRGVWILAFNAENRTKIRSDQILYQNITNLQQHQNQQIASSANGVIWVTTSRMNTKSAKHRHHHKKKKHASDSELMAYGALDENANNNGHIMISYQWKYQALVTRIKDELKNCAFNVWMDIEQMSGSTLEAMADAIERSSIVLICMSESYKESPSCRTEAEYAYKLKKPLVPLKLQPGYDPDGWLGILIGTKLYFDMSSMEKIERNFDGLKKEMANNQPESKTSFPPIEAGSQNVEEPKEISVSEWTVHQVEEWLQRENLSELSKILCKYDGDALLGLQKMYQRAPAFYYASMKDNVGLTDMILLLKFTNSLEKLQ